MSEAIDPQHFRHVLGHFPTGVAAVTSCDESGAPVGLIVGSFTSVSLSPPLVAFLPGKSSSTAPKIVQNGRFCVNVLGAHQESLCRAFASSGDRKFDEVDWTLSPTGLPRITESVAWIECDLEAVHDGGDHDIVVGRVTALDAVGPSLPLLFFQGGYGRFAPLSFAAAGEVDLVEHLRLVDVARPFMEDVAERTQVECFASTAVGGEIVLLAAAGTPAGRQPLSRVGQRLPLIPPLGPVLVAWSQPAIDDWFARAGPRLSTAKRAHFETLLARVRERGWSAATGSETFRQLEATLGRTALEGLTPHENRAIHQLVERLGSEYEPVDIDDPSHRIRNVAVPVFNEDHKVVLQLTLYGLPSAAGRAELDLYLDGALAAAQQVTATLSTGPGTRNSQNPSKGSETVAASR